MGATELSPNYKICPKCQVISILVTREYCATCEREVELGEAINRAVELQPLQTHEQADTGAKREKLYARGDTFPNRIDLIFTNPTALRRLGETYGEGCEKYGPTNWKKGFKQSVFINHALEHIRQYMSGDKTEDHLAHACWNLFTLMYMEEHKPELMDLVPITPSPSDHA